MLPTEWLDSEFYRANDLLEIEAFKFLLLRSLHPEPLMIHLECKYRPNGDEYEQIISWKEAKKENPSHPNLPLKLDMFHCMKSVLVENESDEEDTGSAKEENSLISTKKSETTHQALFMKCMSIVRVWYMQHTILTNYTLCCILLIDMIYPWT